MFSKAEKFNKFIDPVQHWYDKLSDFDKKELVNIKARYESHLDAYVSSERDEIYFNISCHLTVNAQKNELQNLNYHIRNDLDYNREYEKVLAPRSHIIQDSFFNEFALAYRILDDESKGLRVLKNIVRVSLIQLVFDELNRDNIPIRSAKYSEVFTAKGLKYFIELHDSINHIPPTTRFQILYIFSKEKELIRSVPFTKFQEFIKSNYAQFLVKNGKMIKWSRQAFESEHDKRYTDNKPTLIEKYSELEKRLKELS